MTIQKLNGEWKNTAQEGMGDLLVAFGANWAKRKVAASLGYGVGKHRQIIEVNDDLEFEMTIIGMKTHKNKFTANGKEYTAGDGNNKIVAEVDKNGNLVLKSQMMGHDVVITRKLENDDKFILEIQYRDVTATRTFERVK